jgi:hypothetical protein
VSISALPSFFFLLLPLRPVGNLLEIAWFDIADMQESITSDSEINEDGLDALFYIYDDPFIDISNEIVL